MTDKGTHKPDGSQQTALDSTAQAVGQALMAYTEAPASFTVKLISPDGFDCMLTLRGMSGAELLPKVSQALGWAKERGYKPACGCNRAERNGAVVASNNEPDVLTDESGRSYKICELHNAKMYARIGKDGKTWYSHKTASGDWCKGKAKQ